MLDPDYLEQAGDLVADAYLQIEADMLNYLSHKMLKGDVSGQRSLTAIALLSQGSASELRAIIAKHHEKIDTAVLKTVEDAMNRTDADDLARILKGSGKVLSTAPKTRQTAATLLGIKEILERENIAMVTGAANAFFNASTWAITQVNTGVMTTEKALHEGVRRLNRQGISVISYRNTTTGAVTVHNQVDVAVRRHIRSQIRQAGDKLTDIRCAEADVDLVEVSSHTGSRPSHARWEGKIYSLKGEQVINGVRYPDFYAECMSGSLGDIFGGVNCRHAKAPWYPGMSKRYEANPQHPSGESNEDIYQWTQQQRGYERNIRATKRDIEGIKASLDYATGDEKTRLASELISAKGKLGEQQKTIREFIGEHNKVLQRSPRREWAGDTI